MLTIKEIETIVQKFDEAIELGIDTALTEMEYILVKQLYKQTKLDSIEEVRKVLSLYSDTKIKWLKKGLENVLLHGEFQVVIKEVTNPIAPSDSTQPIGWPISVPPVKFDTYCNCDCNCNDYKSENLTKVK